MPKRDADHPRFTSAAWKYIRHAFAWTWVKFTAPIGGDEIGWFRPSVWVGAVIFTTAFYLAWNFTCLGAINTAYESATLPDLMGVESTSLAVKTVREVVGAEPKLKDDGLLEAFAPIQPPRPFYEQFEIYVDSAVAGTADEDARRLRAKFIRDRLKGNQTGTVFWLVWTKTASGTQLVKDLKRIDRDWARKVEARRDAKEYEAFVARLADQLSSHVRPKLRWLERMNGTVQWATVFLFWFIIILCGRRFYWLKTPEGMHAFRNRAPDYRESVNAKVYGSLSYLLAALPSLGFIGTVIGMGEALLLADSLFNEPNKQQAIGRITRQLGFAFDTTLVALVAALLAGIVTVELRSIEMGRVATAAADTGASE